MSYTQLSQDTATINAFYQGMSEGIRTYAHWKDGVQYVGTTGRTLADALADITQSRKERIENIRS